MSIRASHVPTCLSLTAAKRRAMFGLASFNVAFGICFASSVWAQDDAAAQPQFRPRTDVLAGRDVNVLREQLKRMVDSRGPINPLADYVQPRVHSNGSSPAGAKAPDSTDARVERATLDIGPDPSEDEEAMRAPSLDNEAQQRLKAEPPSVSPAEMGLVGLYPPPRIVSNQDAAVTTATWFDDGFRPVVTTSYLPMTPIAMQNDPAAMIPPSLGPSMGTSLPSMPPSSMPSGSAPVTSYPGSFANEILPSTPYGLPPAGLPSGSVPANVMPAPPSYVVPPTGSVSPPIGSIMGPNAGMVPGRIGATGTVPYSPPMPSYSRAGTFVNNAPFVSEPPKAQDARWMVSPSVYQQATNNPCPPVGPAGYTAPIASAGIPNAPVGYPAPVGASPFAYVPPTAMPPAMPVAAARPGFFRRMHDSLHRVFHK